MDSDEIRRVLDARLGRLHARQRLGIESDHEAQVFGQGITFFHIENLTASHRLIEWTLRLCGLYGRGCRNAGKVELRTNVISSPALPVEFDGFVLLHLSDLHADMSGPAMARVCDLVRDLPYDICVMTGDYRGQTYGPFEAALAGVAKVRACLRPPVYSVLGNHDSIRMVPELEAMGIINFLNEHVVIERGGGRIHLAGVDDPHFYRADNLEKATAAIPEGEFSILLSHTPEIYRQAAHADFDVMLSGHTHGGQICLPGGYPITLSSVLPRSMGRGPWRHGRLTGYTSAGAGTSAVPVRFNCRPEITLHRLQRAEPTEA